MHRCILPLAFYAFAANAADLKDYAGTWVMRAGERNLFVLTLASNAGSVQGALDRPAKYDSNNSLFANIRGTRRDRIVRSHFAAGALHFTIQNAADAKDEDSYVMTLKGDGADLLPEDLPAGAVVEAHIFERAHGTAAVATNWEPNRAYVTGDSDLPSKEMQGIYDEDQRVRSGPHIDWKIIGPTDADRRAQTRKLLAAGALHTGADYREAAFVFQHGDSPEDYLLAHTLAMVAVSKGEATAIWIAAATLDRYLQRIGRKQIFGTQYLIDPKSKWTQEPYDRDLVSDALRHQLGVPPQALQAEQLKAYQSQP